MPGPAFLETDMAIYKKSFKPNPPVQKGPVLAPSIDTTRTFDARPKPSDDRRREERFRPDQHVDPIVSDPLDKPDAEPADKA
jgi:hypothetical protein